MFNKSCWWLNLNPGPLVLEATTLPTVPQPLSKPCHYLRHIELLQKSFIILIPALHRWWNPVLRRPHRLLDELREDRVIQSHHISTLKNVESSNGPNHTQNLSNVISKFYHSMATLCLIKSLWLDISSCGMLKESTCTSQSSALIQLRIVMLY